MLAIFGNEANACPYRLRGVADDHAFPADENLTRVFRVRAKDGAQGFRAARADEPRDAQHFTAPHLEAHVAHPLARPQVANDKATSPNGRPAAPLRSGSACPTISPTNAAGVTSPVL